MVEVKDVSPEIKNLLNLIKDGVLKESPWLVYKETGYWINFRDNKHNIAMINPMKSKLRILLRLDCTKYPKLIPTNRTKGENNIGIFNNGFKSKFYVNSERDIANAVRFIIMSEK